MGRPEDFESVEPNSNFQKLFGGYPHKPTKLDKTRYTQELYDSLPGQMYLKDDKFYQFKFGFKAKNPQLLARNAFQNKRARLRIPLELQPDYCGPSDDETDYRTESACIQLYSLVPCNSFHVDYTADSGREMNQL
ncbi:hypothetical protein ABG067_003608 [Albugo candida]